MSCHKHESIKSCSFFKGLGVASLVAAAAGAVFVLYKRSQPVEDPWAEEYWSEVEAEDEEEEAPAAE